MKHAGHFLVSVLFVKLDVPIIGLNEHDSGAVFLGLPLKSTEKTGADPLSPVRLIDPQAINIRAVPAVDAPCDPGNDPAALVLDLFADGDICMLSRREGFVVLAQPETISYPLVFEGLCSMTVRSSLFVMR